MVKNVLVIECTTTYNWYKIFDGATLTNGEQIKIEQATWQEINCTTALVFRPDCADRVLVAYGDRSVAEFDTEAGHLTGWSRWAAQHVPEAWRRRPLPVPHISVTGCGSRVILHDDSGICALDATAGEQLSTGVKRTKTAKGGRKTAEPTQMSAGDSVVITDK